MDHVDETREHPVAETGEQVVVFAARLSQVPRGDDHVVPVGHRLSQDGIASGGQFPSGLKVITTSPRMRGQASMYTNRIPLRCLPSPCAFANSREPSREPPSTTRILIAPLRTDPGKDRLHPLVSLSTGTNSVTRRLSGSCVVRDLSLVIVEDGRHTDRRSVGNNKGRPRSRSRPHIFSRYFPIVSVFSLVIEHLESRQVIMTRCQSRFSCLF